MIKTVTNIFDLNRWNELATHPMQSWEWGAVRKKEGKKIVRFVEYGKKDEATAVYLMTTHPLPYTGYSIGYIPKSTPPSKEFLTYLRSYAQEHKLIFVKLEPNTLSNLELGTWDLGLIVSPHPLFTPWNQVLDISLSEQELLKNMHPKTRYNIHLAEKKGVQVHEMTSEQGYQTFEKLYFETCARQKYHGHTHAYHQNIWNTLSSVDSLSAEEADRQSSELKNDEPNELSELTKPSTFNLTNFINLRSHILVAFYKDTPLAAYQVWHFKDTLYYVYGGSSEEFKNVMAANLLMWETIRLAKQLGCKTLDMWGSLPPTFDTKDPWAGFTKFKQGYGTKFVQYVGSYDLVVHPLFYKLYSLAQTLRQKFML